MTDLVLARLQDGLADNRLELPRCADCGTLVWYPRARCPHCMSGNLVWEELSGTGTVYSYTVNHRGQGEYAGHDPFVIAYVELAEGPRVLSHVDSADVRVGDPVRLRGGLSQEGHVRLTFEKEEPR
ncbi:Zn-ribbon domain-containing OB-fold protein [Actinophytocola sp.]|uniref:Zn-ribbon domain-containing OB-fold protein n=1 Tax=Actinophytocola sp. TaxID=1872138 RepID=UPI002D67B6F3|nr:Zn-ribbon domain-containing OB-fold protein [Actinophytocola sp.]HYQ68174.1 Zn-ribbon domain-containing OB-fold protein [Actinophytocola sp.]